MAVFADWWPASCPKWAGISGINNGWMDRQMHGLIHHLKIHHPAKCWWLQLHKWVPCCTSVNISPPANNTLLGWWRCLISCLSSGELSFIEIFFFSMVNYKHGGGIKFNLSQAHYMLCFLLHVFAVTAWINATQVSCNQTDGSSTTMIATKHLSAQPVNAQWHRMILPQTVREK